MSITFIIDNYNTEVIKIPIVVQCEKNISGARQYREQGLR